MSAFATDKDNAMENPLISVLVPIYNVDKYLDQCLSSLQNQTYKNLEILCINDGSTDASPEIIKRYMENDSRFKMIDKNNSGYGDSMNQGLKAATGDYVGILESDDFLDLNAFESLVNAAIENNVDVVKADYYLYHTKTDNDDRALWTDENLYGLVNPECNKEVFFRPPSIWSGIYKRQFLVENEISFLPTPGASYQDTSFAFKIWAACDRAYLINKAYLHYRQDNENSSINSAAKVFCVCDEYAEMHAWLDKHVSDNGWLKAILSRMRYNTYLWNYERIADEFKQSWLQRMIADFISDDDSGYTDRNVFPSESWRIRDLILNNPDVFIVMKQLETTPHTKRETFEAYRRSGGFKAIGKALSFKLGGRFSNL